MSTVVKIPPVCTGGARAGVGGAIGGARAGAGGAIGGARASSARRVNGEGLPPGWHYDEDTGAIMRDVIHRMGRRCRNWDYHGRGTYLITMVLADRSKPIFGQLTGASPDAAAIALSPLGLAIDALLKTIIFLALGMTAIYKLKVSQSVNDLIDRGWKMIRRK